MRIDESELSRYLSAERKTYAYDSLLGLKKDKYIEINTNIRVQNRILIVGILAVIISWFYVRLGLLEEVFKIQYELYYKEESHFNSSPSPNGSDNFSIREVAIAAEFPEYYNTVLVGTMTSKQLTTTGAIFLLIMLARYPDDITREMWAGTSDQLGASKLHADPGGFLHNFQSWNVIENKFRWICKTPSEFERHVAIQCKIKTLANHSRGDILTQGTDSLSNMLTGEEENNSTVESQLSVDILNSLYSGGLCKLARLHVAANTSPDELVEKVVGRISLFYADCDAQKRMRRASTVTNVVGAGATGLGIVHYTAGAMFGGPVAIVASLGIIGATAVTSYFMGKNTYDTTICTPPNGAVMVNADQYTYNDLACGRS